MGLGDVKLAAVLGAVLGFPLILMGLLYGILAGGWRPSSCWRRDAPTQRCMATARTWPWGHGSSGRSRWACGHKALVLLG